jgi:hypothetical protein
MAKGRIFRMSLYAAICLIVTVQSEDALANAPDLSVRPVARPTIAAPTSTVRYDAKIRPKPRTAWSAPDLRTLLDRTTLRQGPAQTPISPANSETEVSQQTLPLLAAAPVTTLVGPIVRFQADIRPRARPWVGRTRPIGTVATPVVVPTAPVEPGQIARTQLASTAPVFASPRPPIRPEDLQRRATVWASGLARTTPTPQVSATGAICGDRALRGRRISAIPGRLSGCGIGEPVQVTQVHGITLSTAATMDCGTAQALSAWVRNGAMPAIGNTGGGIAQFRVAAHYACRTRNSQPGARISEHGKGRAIDISAFRLKNGDTITLLEGWNDRRQGRILRDMWRAACGPFGTVLGPESNRFHLDHFHFDTARYRSGAYCR